MCLVVKVKWANIVLQYNRKCLIDVNRTLRADTWYLILACTYLPPQATDRWPESHQADKALGRPAQSIQIKSYQTKTYTYD